MREDISLCCFEIVNDYCVAFSRLCSEGKLFPYGCDPDSFTNYQENLVGFFYDRTTPSTRYNIDNELRKIGIPYYDMSRLILYQYGAAQNPFWVRQSAGPQTWAELQKYLLHE